MGVLTTVKTGATNLLMWANTHSSALLTATGEANLFLAVYSSVIATRESTRILDNEEEERIRLNEPEMTFGEKFRMVGPYYIPTILFTLIGGGCFLLNTIQEERRIATLAGLYSMTEKSFEEYKEKTKEMFGEKKEQRIRDELDRKRIEEHPVTNSPVIITGNGQYLCYDTWSDRYFRSTINDVKRAHVEIREDLISNMYVSLNEVYEKLRLPSNLDGYDLGFTVEDKLEFSYSSQLADNGEPALAITFIPPPHPDYNRLY